MFPRLVRVTDERYAPRIAVESKGYIVVGIGQSAKATNLYWQFVDPIFSLLQLGFEWPTGRLVHCSIPLFNGEVENGDAAQLCEPTAGTPYFDLSTWPLRITETKGVFGNVVQEQGRIKLVRTKNSLSIVAKECLRSRSVVYGDAFVCHFDEGDELVGLTLIGVFRV
jgi:hypothetical protein